MKVLLITSLYPSQQNPSLGIFVKRQVESLRALGVDVDVVSSDSVRTRSRVFASYSRLMARTAIQAFRTFDLVHVHYPTIAGVCGALLRLLRRKPLVLTIHGGELDEPQVLELPALRRLVTRVTVRIALARADAVIVVGKGLEKAAIERGVEEDRVYTIDMGVDTAVFHPGSRTERRRALGLAERTPTVVFVGALTPQKGTEQLIRAAAIVHESIPSCEWHLIGAGSQADELKNLADLLGISRVVSFHGFLAPDSVALWQQAADVCVVPSLAEGFGLAALEGMACGTPVIASNVGGLRDLIVDGKNGRLIAPGDPVAMAAAVTELLESPRLRETLSESAREVVADHSLVLQTQRVLNVYRKVLREPKHR